MAHRTPRTRSRPGLEHVAVRFGHRQIADDRVTAALRDTPRFFFVTDQRGHLVAGAHQRIQYGGADGVGRAGQKDSHEGRIS
jgi:protein-L-isoaspartate O-methyltransferase